MAAHRVTHAEAAEILGCHLSNIAKLIRKGDLHSERRRNGALDRAEVEGLAERRRQPLVSKSPRSDADQGDPRPDTEHEWLAPSQVASEVGLTPQAITKRARRGTLPAVEHRGRWWVRRDHLELVERARLARSTGRP